MRRFGAAAAISALLALAACSSGSRVRQLGGLLDVQPANLDFGDVALGLESSHAVALQNTGLVPMTVTDLPQFSDPAFEVTGLPVTLAPGQSAKVNVRYRPPAVGMHRRTLQLATDSPELPSADVSLAGHGVRGLATLSADSFDFGDVVVDETATQTFSLLNDDGHAVTSIAIAAPAGADADSFCIDQTGPKQMLPQQSLTVAIDFRPQRLGSFAARLEVTPCPTCAPHDVLLTGRGVTSLLTVAPAAIDFGEVILSSVAERPFTVTNTSRAPLPVQAMAFSGGADLSVSLEGAPLPRTFAPGETVNGIVRFAPRALLGASAQATFTAADGGPATLSVTGIGVGAVVQVSPRSVFVGPAELQTTRTGSVLVTNAGYDPSQIAPLQISAVRIDDDDGSWQLTQSAGAVGEPGASATLQFSFTPQSAGISQAMLVIESNDGLHPSVAVPISGIGRDLKPCTLNVAPPSPVDFGSVKLSQPTVQGFELTNTTGDDCIIGDPAIVSGGPAFHWPGGVAPLGRTLPPNGRMSVRIELTAEQAGPISGAVQFYVSNKSAPSMTVALTATGSESCFFLSPGTVDFGGTTLGCGVPDQAVYAVNQCSYPVSVSSAGTSGAPFSLPGFAPVVLAPNTNAAIDVRYGPAAAGDDVGQVWAALDDGTSSTAGLTGGAQPSATILDQWDQSTPKVDLLMIVDNSGSMQQEQSALQANLDHLWNRIALANADFHIAVTTSGMSAYTSGWTQCPGGASGGEAGRFFPVDDSNPRLLTPETPDVRDALFADTKVGTCHWDERFLEPAVAALTPPLSTSTKAPGTSWPADGNAGFLRSDARLAILIITDTDDDNKLVNPPPVSGYVDQLVAVKGGARDLISFAAVVPLEYCANAEQYPTPRFVEAAQLLNGHLYDACNLSAFGTVLENALGSLLAPLSSFPLSAVPRDPSAIVVTVDGATVTDWSYDANSNRIVFPPSSIPPPGAHISAQYQPACP